MEEIIKFVEELMKLKDVKRTGWVNSKVSEPESVADHSFSLAVLAYLFAKQIGVDENKAVKMALIHDINEILTGDIATRFNEEEQVVDNHTKQIIENENTRKILSLLPENLHEELLQLWEDYNNLKSPEAKLVYSLDKLDYTIQAMHYKKNKRTKEDLSEYLKTANQRIKMPEVRKVFEEIRELMRNMK